MNDKSVEHKNNYPTDAVNNRLMRLEKILQVLTALLGVDKENNHINQVDSFGNAKNSLPSIKEEINNFHRAATINDNLSSFRKNNSKNSILLSNGQIVSEIAAMILRANRRNF